MSDPDTIQRALSLILIARNLERIGDHATNICEEVIYWIQGRDVRHQRSRPATSEVAQASGTPESSKTTTQTSGNGANEGHDASRAEAAPGAVTAPSTSVASSGR